MVYTIFYLLSGRAGSELVEVYKDFALRLLSICLRFHFHRIIYDVMKRALRCSKSTLDGILEPSTA